MKKINLQEAQRRLAILLEAYDSLFIEENISPHSSMKVDMRVREMKLDFDNYMLTQILKRAV